MSDYDFSLVRWPFNVETPDHEFTFRDLTTFGLSVQTITQGIYINSGDGETVAPKDFVKAFIDAAQAAATALPGVQGTLTPTLLPSGKLYIEHTSVGNLLQVVGLTDNQKAWLGSSFATGTISNITMGFQMGCMWYPGVDQNYDSENELRDIVHEDQGVDGSVRRLVLSAAEWNERVIVWDRVAGAIMKNSRSIVQAYCDVAGVSLNEDNTWEEMWRYLKGAVGPYGDNRVYVYPTNIAVWGMPSSSPRNGPYDVILSKCRPGLLGIEAESYVQGLSSEFFPVKIALKEI